MTKRLASRRLARGGVVSSLIGLAALSFAGCWGGDEPPRIGVHDTALGSDGTLHVVSRIEQLIGESQYVLSRGFAYTRRAEVGYETVSSSLSDGQEGGSESRAYRIVFDGQGRLVLAAELDQGLVVQRFEGGQWKTVPFDPAFSTSVTLDLAKTGQLGGAWTASDGIVRVMYGQRIFRVDEGGVYQHKSQSQGCALHDRCQFDPTGDDAGEAVMFSTAHDAFELSRMSCEGDCSWTTVGPIGSSDQGYWDEPSIPLFFHTIDGKGRFIQKVTPDSGDGFKLLASTLEDQVTLFEDGVIEIGGAPRPDGGFVVAAAGGTGSNLYLATFDADGTQKTIDLGKLKDIYGDLSVHVRGLPNEEVHIVFQESGVHLSHYVVSLPSGTSTVESIPVEWSADASE